jgi:hypothetical protein
MLSRQQAGVRVMHLAEVLASTEDDQSDPDKGGSHVAQVLA